MILDEVLPEYDFNEIHVVTVKAKPAVVYVAVKELLPVELSPVVFWLLNLRTLPARLMGRVGQETWSETPFLTQMLAGGFIPLADAEPEFVFGLIGQFWKLNGGENVQIADRQAFVDFKQTDYAKVAANLICQAENDGTRLSTETRIWAPDAETRRKFAFYWRLISWGSGWIRVMWLRAIKRRAERA